MMSFLYLLILSILINLAVNSHATGRGEGYHLVSNCVEFPLSFADPNKCVDFFEDPFGSSPQQSPPRLFKPLQELQYHGTTTLSFICRDGIVVAVDSRASVGNYVGSRTVKKVFPITKYVIATMAGGAADCAFWIRRTARQVNVLEQEYGGSPLRVGAIARLLASSLREHRHSELSVGTMVAGFDLETMKPSLYYVDSEGNCVPGECFCVGSGGSLAYSILDDKDLHGGKELIDLSIDEAVDTAICAIRHAAHRDGYSGGYINVLHIDAKGCKHIRRIDSRKITIPSHMKAIIEPNAVPVERGSATAHKS